MPKRIFLSILLLLLLTLAACGGGAAPAISSSAPAASSSPSAPKPLPGSAVSSQQILKKIDVLLIADANTYTGANWKTQFESDINNLIASAFPADYGSLRNLYQFYLAQDKGRFSVPCTIQLFDGNPATTLAGIAPSMDIGALIHRGNAQDCANGYKFSAEHDQPLTFLHELGHASLALADEYGVGAGESSSAGGYWRPSPELNGTPTPSNIYRILATGDECPSIASGMGWSQTDCREIPGLIVTQVGRWSRSHTLPRNLMRIAGSAPPPSFGVAFVRGIQARLNWALTKCSANLCASVGVGASTSMGGHEPIFVKGEEEDQRDEQPVLTPRSLLLVLQFSGAEIEVLEERIVEGPTRGYVVQSVPHIQIEVGNPESEQRPQRYYIWDPRIALLENDDEDPLSGEMVILDPVIFDVVVPLDESSRPRVVRLRYPAEPTFYPGWDEDPGNIDAREKVIPISKLDPLTLVIGWPRQFLTLNPFVMGQALFAPPNSDSLSEGLIVTTQVLEGLTQVLPGIPDDNTRAFPTVPGVDNDNRIAVSADVSPLLADSFEVSDDGSAWTFRLREGILFHDGTPLTSGAVEANFQRWLAAGYWSVAFDDFNNQTRFEITDDFTFQLIFESPQADVAQLLALPYFAINSPDALKNFADAYGNPGVGVVGTGPFRYAGAEGNRLLLTRNDNYWGTPALPDGIVFRYLSDPDARLVALLEEQSVDLAAGLPPDTPQIAAGQAQILSDFYRYPDEPFLAAQHWVGGWQPSPFYLEQFAPIQLNR